MQSQNIEHQLTQDLLKNQVPSRYVIHKAHSNSIEAIAAHPSHKQFASGSHDHTIKLWDLGKFKEEATYTDHKEGVWSLDYSSDGKFLVSASVDKGVFLWDTKKAAASQKLLGHTDKVYAAKVSEDDKFVASIGEGAELFIWDLAKPKEPVKKLNLDAMVGYDICWSQDGTTLFATTIGGKTAAINAKTFEITDVAKLNVDFYIKMEGVCANWKTLNGKIFSGCDNGIIAWYSYSNNKLQKEIEFVGHLGAGCRNVNLHPTEKFMLSSGKDGSVRLWDCSKEGKPVITANLVGHTENVTSPVFIGKEVVVTGSWDQDIRLWNFKDLLPK